MSQGWTKLTLLSFLSEYDKTKSQVYVRRKKGKYQCECSREFDENLYLI